MTAATFLRLPITASSRRRYATRVVKSLGRNLHQPKPIAADAGSAGVGCPDRLKRRTRGSHHGLRTRPDFRAEVGRAGIEPATLGLKVRAEKLQPEASS
jgi:hypothetical protein